MQAALANSDGGSAHYPAATGLIWLGEIPEVARENVRG
jgi:hypothetical protein